MVHLGDITQMSGYTIPPVDVVTFGSPCQDYPEFRDNQTLSIAGKRAGMAGEILFEPESLRGHFAPGITPGQAAPVVVGGCTEDANRAFTLKIRSGCEGGGKGALVQIEKSATLSTLQDQTLFVAEPPKAYSFDSLASNSMKSSNPHSGCREVEIAKTLDTSPPDPAKNQGGIAIVEPTFCIQGNTIDRADTAGANGTGVKEDVCYTLNTIDRPAVAFALDCRNMTANEELSATLQAKDSGGQSLNYINPVAEPLIYDARGNGDGITSPTMTGDHNSRVTDYTAITLQGDTVAGALLARDYKGPGRADSLGRVIAQPVGADLYNGTLTGDKAATLTTATGQGGANTGPSVIEKIIRWIVRRLTPTECERLQGYPDGWTDLGEWVDSKGKTHKDADTPRYKALGNSIALPQWYYVLGGISDRLPEDATLGSLFDGIGGFPYVWAQLHAGRKELCVWASEIEEFPIAVTKKWFPEVEDGKLF